MQQATHHRLHVRDAHDAHVVFEAVRQGFLKPVTRRLNEMERAMHVRSGAIFVWVECDDDAGLKRWTDGRVWGQSRMREPYLFYDEKLPYDLAQNQNEQANRSPTFRFVDGVARPGPTSSAVSHQDRNSNPHPGLVKQAYSAWVTPDARTKPQKWHLTAYFTYADLHNLPTIDGDPVLCKIIVPANIYRSGKARSRNEDESRLGHIETGSRSTPSERVPPTLPSLQATVGAVVVPMTHTRSHGMRIAEDQRVIQMLNSRPIL
ncbi:hypothetical protein BDN72DRAFT_225151 [Pluteus cervinus]|uniref:Uncharacterized protein n=1 Tax=Pluteus cervinus TaxID=181527 RepID=A0ACD3BCZ9_9AGAR|nr:hypothetical protein BDN72DRAFT_225151 [Pluteus cervinus]